MRLKVPMHQPESHCSIVARKRSNVRGAKGAGHSRQDRVNGEPEELFVLMEGGGLLLGWHEPDEARASRPDLWEARGEIPRAYPAVKRRGIRSRHVGMRKTSANEPLMTHRKCLDGIKTGELLCPGKSMADTYLLAMRCPV